MTTRIPIKNWITNETGPRSWQVPVFGIRCGIVVLVVVGYIYLAITKVPFPFALPISLDNLTGSYIVAQPFPIGRCRTRPHVIKAPSQYFCWERTISYCCREADGSVSSITSSWTVGTGEKCLLYRSLVYIFGFCIYNK